MCRIGTSFVFGVALVATLVINAPAVAQYAPTEDPAVRQAEEVKKLRQDLKRQQAPPTAPDRKKADQKQAPETAPWFDSVWGWIERNWLKLLIVLVGLGLVVFVWRRNTKATNKPTDKKDTGTTNANHMIALLALAGGLAGLATITAPVYAAPMEGCVVTAVNGTVGDAAMSVLVVGADNFVSCATMATDIKLVDGKGNAMPVKKLVKTSNGFNFSLIPTVAAELHVVDKATGNKVASLFTNSAFGAWTALGAVQSVRPEIKAAAADATAAKAAAVTMGDRFTAMFGSDGRGGTVGGAISDLQRDVAALKVEVKKTVDLSAYDRRLKELDGELQKEKAARVRLAEDLSAVKKTADDAKVLGERLGEVRTGVWRPRTLASRAVPAKRE